MPLSLILKSALKHTHCLTETYSGPRGSAHQQSTAASAAGSTPRPAGQHGVAPYRWVRHYPPEQTQVNHEEKTHPLAGSPPAAERIPDEAQ